MAKVSWIQVDGKPLDTEDIREVTISLGPRRQIKVSRPKTEGFLVEMTATDQGIRFEVGEKHPTGLDKIVKKLREYFPGNHAD